MLGLKSNRLVYQTENFKLLRYIWNPDYVIMLTITLTGIFDFLGFRQIKQTRWIRRLPSHPELFAFWIKKN